MKKYENLFQIGEVAALLNISRKMLLNYENHGLIAPALVDADTGYRYFDSYTVARIQLILDLRRTGMTIPDIGKYFKGSLSAKKQIDILKGQIAAARKAVEQLEIRNKDSKEPPKVKEIILPERCCICREIRADNVDEAISAVVDSFGECIARKIPFSECGFHFCEFQKNLFDKDFYELESISMKICICIDKVHAPSDAVFYPETKALSVSFCGEYDKSVSSYEILKNHLTENNIEVTGFPEEVYLEGNFDNASDKNIVLIIVPIK